MYVYAYTYVQLWHGLYTMTWRCHHEVPCPALPSPSRCCCAPLPSERSEIFCTWRVTINNQTLDLAENGVNADECPRECVWHFWISGLKATHCSLGSAPLAFSNVSPFTPTPGSFSGALRELSVSEHTC